MQKSFEKNILNFFSQFFKNERKITKEKPLDIVENKGI